MYLDQIPESIKNRNRGLYYEAIGNRLSDDPSKISIPEHAVEGDGKRLELVARVNIGPKRHIAVADRIAHVAQVV